jgi:hypothetical protein
MTISATPNQPQSIRVSINKPDVKVATPDLILFDDSLVPIDVMSELLFESIGGQELINVSRTDMLNGSDVLYQPIKNISSLQYQYNPQNILGLQSGSNTYFKNFTIKFEEKVPTVGNGPDGSPVYIDQSTGNLVIDVVNLSTDEKIEVQIVSSGEILNGTIY